MWWVSGGAIGVASALTVGERQLQQLPHAVVVVGSSLNDRDTALGERNESLAEIRALLARDGDIHPAPGPRRKPHPKPPPPPPVKETRAIPREIRAMHTNVCSLMQGDQAMTKIVEVLTKARNNGSSIIGLSEVWALSDEVALRIRDSGLDVHTAMRPVNTEKQRGGGATLAWSQSRWSHTVLPSPDTTSFQLAAVRLTPRVEGIENPIVVACIYVCQTCTTNEEIQRQFADLKAWCLQFAPDICLGDWNAIGDWDLRVRTGDVRKKRGELLMEMLDELDLLASVPTNSTSRATIAAKEIAQWTEGTTIDFAVHSRTISIVTSCSTERFNFETATHKAVFHVMQCNPDTIVNEMATPGCTTHGVRRVRWHQTRSHHRRKAIVTARHHFGRGPPSQCNNDVPDSMSKLKATLHWVNKRPAAHDGHATARGPQQGRRLAAGPAAQHRRRGGGGARNVGRGRGRAAA